MIGAIVVLNALLGYVQEQHAESAGGQRQDQLQGGDTTAGHDDP